MARRRDPAVRCREMGRGMGAERERGGRDIETNSRMKTERDGGKKCTQRCKQKEEPGETEKQQTADTQAVRGGSIQLGKKGPS